jgi:hypothetical protein
MISEDKEIGIKRIRIVASIIAAVMFGTTAVTQFQGEPTEMMITGVIVSAVLGFAFMWIVITIVKFILKLIRNNRTPL